MSNNFDKCVLAVVAGMIVLIIFGALAAAEMRYDHEENMAKLGYEQVAMPGTDVMVWRKTGTEGR